MMMRREAIERILRPADTRGSWVGLLAAGVLAVITASCQLAPPVPETEPVAAGPEAMMAAGDYAGAAREWQRMALSADPPESALLRIQAAEAWLLADRPELAADNLRWVDADTLPPEMRARMDLALADVALRSDRPRDAWALLQRVQPVLPANLQTRWDQLRRDIAQALDRPETLDFSRAIELSEALRSYQPDQAVELLRSLESIPSGDLETRAANPRDNPLLKGWLDLALVTRRNLVDGSDLATHFAAWKSRHPDHFMTEADALDLWQRYRSGFTPPGRVAVLLPDAGRLASAAEALRDGIMSAYLDQPGGAEIFFLNAGTEAESTPSAYFEARDRGADWIIGPVQKESITALLELAGLMTPMLALNDLPELYLPPAGLSAQIFGISLSQEREVAATAEAAIAAGFRRAIVLAPEGAWGERMAQGFSDVFLQRNGEIVTSVRYPEQENDHTALLERMLKIDESIARKDQLQNVLQLPVDFEPVRRTDIDVIFLAANPTQGRLIAPQLKFHHAGDVPVFATGRIYSGQPERQRNQDLNGVHLPLTPLELQQTRNREPPELMSARGGTLTSLQALGRDAWNVLPWLRLMRSDPDFRFYGLSGTYRATSSGNLAREPQFAVFRNGTPAPLPVEQRQPESIQFPLPPPAPQQPPTTTPDR